MGWNWVQEAAVLAIHREQIAEHGGENGLRDAGLLSSALARPLQLASYGSPSVFDLGAAYAAGIMYNHPFVDGNKRVSFLAAYVFLGLNGYRLQAEEVDVVETVLALANKKFDEKQFSDWLQKNSGSQ